MVKAIIAHGGAINVKDLNHNTPLHYAASLGHRRVIELLISRGCVPNVKNKKFMEPIHAAILSDDLKNWNFFLSKANPDDKFTVTKEIIDRKLARGVTPLMMTIENDCQQMFGHLLRLGVNVNHHEENGKTPMHWAIEKGTVCQPPIC